MIDIRKLTSNELEFIASRTVFELTDPDNIKEYYRMVNEQGQTDLYILFLSQIQNNENVDDIINKDINAYNELAKTLNSKLLIYNKNFNNLTKLLLYLRHLSYKNAYNIN